jgi:hypothetical protein
MVYIVKIHENKNELFGLNLRLGLVIRFSRVVKVRFRIRFDEGKRKLHTALDSITNI